MKKLLLIALLGLFAFANQSFAQGCVEVSDEEGAQIFGFIQPQADYQFLGETKSGESMNTSSLYFNRARLGVVGNIPYDFSYYFVSEMSPLINGGGGASILDAFVTYNRFGPYFKVSFGQFKTPFGLEQMTACHKLHTINRSEVVNNLSGPIRDFGVMFSGGTDTLSLFGSKTKNLFGYSIAVVNGTGRNLQDNNVKKDILGRVTFHPFEFITVGASYRFGAHPSAAGLEEDDTRKRLGFDVELKYKEFLLQGEYTKGADVGSYTTGGGCGGDLEFHEGSVNRNGFFVQGMYMTPWRLQPLVKYEYYEPNADAEIIDDQRTIITYGLNYFFNDWTRLQINYLYKVEESGNVEITNDALLLQIQVQF
jgi:phosphate-selective porin